MNEHTSQNSYLQTTSFQPVRVLLLDDEPASLFLRAIVLRQQGYLCIPVDSIEAAARSLNDIDIAVLDYHLGDGRFGTDVAVMLKQLRPEVPVIILSATPEHRFGGVEDIHLLKGYSSNQNLLDALKSLEAKKRGTPVVVDAREFFYSRIALAIGMDVLVQIMDGFGNWIYCNEAVAEYLGQPREWFPGRNLHEEMPLLMRDWQETITAVAEKRETYIDRSRRGLLVCEPEHFTAGTNVVWSVMAFPVTLHDARNGVVLTARVLGNNCLSAY